MVAIEPIGAGHPGDMGAQAGHRVGRAVVAEDAGACDMRGHHPVEPVHQRVVVDRAGADDEARQRHAAREALHRHGREDAQGKTADADIGHRPGAPRGAAGKVRAERTAHADLPHRADGGLQRKKTAVRGGAEGQGQRVERDGIADDGFRLPRQRPKQHLVAHPDEIEHMVETLDVGQDRCGQLAGLGGQGHRALQRAHPQRLGRLRHGAGEARAVMAEGRVFGEDQQRLARGRAGAVEQQVGHRPPQPRRAIRRRHARSPQAAGRAAGTLASGPGLGDPWSAARSRGAPR